MTNSYAARVAKFIKDNDLEESDIVFRLEDAKGEGVYQSRKDYISLANDPHGVSGAPHRPSPSEDRMGFSHDRDREFRFAFDDFDQMHRWFNRAERKALRAVGCDVYVYEVTKQRGSYRAGKNQVIFKKIAAQKVGKIII